MDYLTTDEVGDIVFELRKTKGETLEEFGKRFDTHAQIIKSWEDGVHYPSIKNLRILAKMIGIYPGDLIRAVKG